MVVRFVSVVVLRLVSIRLMDRLNNLVVKVMIRFIKGRFSDYRFRLCEMVVVIGKVSIRVIMFRVSSGCLL